MAVPAHDERDYAFAMKYDLPIRRVVKAVGGELDELPFTSYDGVLVNSGEFDGMTVTEGKKAVIEKLMKTDEGRFKVNYRLRDWLVSRQRYWGAPIPMIHCEHCGEVMVPEKDLPVELPYDVDFTPDGRSPLSKHEGFMNVTCPKCGRPARRDPDTLDTFVCSSWYYLRYADPKNDSEAWDPAWINKLLPVDKYVGGAEHACMHLLYARFFTKALRDMGYLAFDEPFKSLVHQGTILGPDGNKMSKSKGNVVSPDEFINQYGSDVFRTYLAFGFAYTEGGPGLPEGIKAVNRYIERVERLVERVIALPDENKAAKTDGDVRYAQHYAIKNVTQDVDKFSFNTAVARLMELTNALYKALDDEYNPALIKAATQDLVIMLSVFAPHFSEEMWEKMGNSYSIFNQSWPIFDEKALVRNEVEIVVQVNGKVRGKFTMPAGAPDEEIEAAALREERVTRALEGKAIRKIIVVKGKLVNIVV